MKYLKKLIQLRKKIHAQPEIGFDCHHTKDLILQFLSSIGIIQKPIILAKTGFIIDLYGTGQPKQPKKIIAFRADMDALNMKQLNQFQYKSKNKYAHMCGHDGHSTCLVAFATIFHQRRDEIPSNRAVRLLFQPSQQGPDSGAKVMIQQGCLEGINQIYGYHNIPKDLTGKLWIKSGPVMSQVSVLKIVIHGTEGHGSEPEGVIDSIKGGILFHQQLDKILAVYKQKKINFVLTLPIFNGGERFNVFSKTTILQGTLRSFQPNLNMQLKKQIEKILNDLEKQGFKTQLTFKKYFNMCINHEKESEHVERVAKTFFGEQNVSQGSLPLRASEDFSFYLEKIPGSFFFLTSAKSLPYPMIHSSIYDFDDNLIEKAATFYMKLAKDRLND